ncbi:hypothetical protein C8R42DRAFT_713572, partial [Lentinula raphanica]
MQSCVAEFCYCTIKVLCSTAGLCTLLHVFRLLDLEIWLMIPCLQCPLVEHMCPAQTKYLIAALSSIIFFRLTLQGYPGLYSAANAFPYTSFRRSLQATPPYHFLHLHRLFSRLLPHFLLAYRCQTRQQSTGLQRGRAKGTSIKLGYVTYTLGIALDDGSCITIQSCLQRLAMPVGCFRTHVPSSNEIPHCRIVTHSFLPINWKSLQGYRGLYSAVNAFPYASFR